MPRDLTWLEDVLHAIDRIFWRDELERMGVTIRWARFRPTKQTFTYARYYPTDKLIEVSPILALDFVPDEVVSFSVYHETIHAIQDPQPESHNSRYKHDHAFRIAEMRHPHAVEAEIWCAENLNALIAARPLKTRK